MVEVYSNLMGAACADLCRDECPVIGSFDHLKGALCGESICTNGHFYSDVSTVSAYRCIHNLFVPGDWTTADSKVLLGYAPRFECRLDRDVGLGVFTHNQHTACLFVYPVRKVYIGPPFARQPDYRVLVVSTCGVADQSSGFIEYGQVVVLKQDLGQWWWWLGWCDTWHEYSQDLCAF